MVIAVTRLFDAEVDEQLITEVTGHRSTAVRNYKRTSDAKRQKVNSIIQGSSVEDSKPNIGIKNVEKSDQAAAGKDSDHCNFSSNKGITININIQ